MGCTLGGRRSMHSFDVRHTGSSNLSDCHERSSHYIVTTSGTLPAYSRLPKQPTHSIEISINYLTGAQADECASDRAELRPALLFDSLAA